MSQKNKKIAVIIIVVVLALIMALGPVMMIFEWFR